MKKIIISATISVIALVTIILTVNKSADKENTTSSNDTLADSSAQEAENIRAIERANRPAKKIHETTEEATTISLDEELEQKISASIKSISEPGGVSKLLKDMLDKNSDKKEKSKELGIQALIKKLNLDESQAKALREYMTEKDQTLAELGSMENIMSGKLDGTKILPLLKDEHLLNAMEPHFNEEQNEALAAHQQNQIDNKIDSAALSKLSKIQGAVNLTPEQRENVYEQLTTDATAEFGNTSDEALLQNYIASSFSAPGINVRASNSNNNPDAPGSQIDNEVEKMTPFLDEVQLQQYRNHLESNSPESRHIRISQ